MLFAQLRLFIDITRFREEAGDSVAYLTGIVQKLRLMWVEIFPFLRTIQTDVLSPNHLSFTKERSPPVMLQTLYVTENPDKLGGTNANLSQKVLLGILMQRRDGSSWSEPSVNRDVVFISLSKATVVRDTDVFFQLRHLEEQILLLVFHSNNASNKQTHTKKTTPKQPNKNKISGTSVHDSLKVQTPPSDKVISIFAGVHSVLVLKFTNELH